MAKEPRLSDVAAIQALPPRDTQSTRYGFWVQPMTPTMECCDGPSVGDEKMSTAVKYLKRG